MYVRKSAFKIMQERKKSTILFFTILLIILECTRRINGTPHPSHLSFYANEENKELICVADNDVLDSAVDWVYPIPNGLENVPKIVTHLEPKINASFECNFGNGKICNQFWISKNWSILTHSPLNFKLILDSRWESFPLILTKNGTLSNKKIQLPSATFNLGISVRASKDAQILLCEGWDVDKYPCYYIDINENHHNVSLKKYKNGLLKDGINIKSKNMTQSFLLSEFEWRTYNIMFTQNGTLYLNDSIANNNIIEYTDNKPLKIIYLLMRSEESALWKVHTTEFLYTNETGTFPFGKPIPISRLNQCIEFKNTMCKNCRLILFAKENDTEKILGNLTSNDPNIWKSDRMFINLLQNNVQIYTRTEIVNKSEEDHLFWAIDYIRECAEKEIKVTRIKLDNLNNTDKISCQSLKHPEWRPNKQILPKIKELPKLTFNSTSTSIEISWKNDPQIENIHPHYYMIQNAGQMQCGNDTRDIKRALSLNYHIIRDTSDLIITNLLPHTHYIITFKDVLYARNSTNKTNTRPTEIPINENLPNNVNITTNSTSATFKWDSPPCYKIFGSLYYEIIVNGIGVNVKKTVYQPEGVITNLKPFQNYTATISTRIHSGNTTPVDKIYHFQTLPGKASNVENLEVYSTDYDRAYIRFRLPEESNGIPNIVMVKYCHPLYENGCKSKVNHLERCKLWEDMYCIKIENLIKKYDYTFQISVKNTNSSTYGDSVNVTTFTTQKLPGTPSNLSATIINCTDVFYDCHVNVSWTYPYYPNGTINTFDIDIIPERIVGNFSDQNEVTSSIVKVPENLNRNFSHVIKYIPYSKTYNISVKSCYTNKFCGKEEKLILKNNENGNVTKQTPKLIDIKETTITFNIPKQNFQSSDNITLYVMVQDYSNNTSLQKPTNNTNHTLCNSYGENWLASIVHIKSNDSINVTIGDGSNQNKAIINKPLESNKKYCLTFMFVSNKNDTDHVIIYHEKNLKTEEIKEITTSKNYLLILFLVLILLPTAWYSYRYFKRRRFNFCRKNENEHVYEYIPNNSITNDAYESYDMLIHK